MLEATTIKQMMTRLAPLVAKVNDLEVQYLSLKAGVTASKAAMLGFKDVGDVQFISKKTLGKLSLQNEL